MAAATDEAAARSHPGELPGQFPHRHQQILLGELRALHLPSQPHQSPASSNATPCLLSVLVQRIFLRDVGPCILMVRQQPMFKRRHTLNQFLLRPIFFQR